MNRIVWISLFAQVWDGILSLDLRSARDKVGVPFVGTTDYSTIAHREPSKRAASMCRHTTTTAGGCGTNRTLWRHLGNDGELRIRPEDAAVVTMDCDLWSLSSESKRWEQKSLFEETDISTWSILETFFKCKYNSKPAERKKLNNMTTTNE